MQDKKKIFILLTRFPDNGAKVIEALTGCYYSHTSIGLSEDMNTFYSFVVKGFIIEDINRYVKPDKDPMPCQLYEIEVSDQVYNTVKRIINFYIRYKHKMSYAKMGLVMTLMRIPFKKKYEYFCSEFVAEVLKRANVLKIKKPTHLCLPKDLIKPAEVKLIFEGNLRSLIQQFQIQPCIA